MSMPGVNPLKIRSRDAMPMSPACPDACRRGVRCLALLSLAAIALCSTPASAAGPRALAIDLDNPPQGVFSDEWYAVMLNGSKSGHMHATMQRVKKGGDDFIRMKMDMILEIGRAGRTVKMTVKQETEETVAGEPRGFSNTMIFGALPTPNVTRGTIRDGKVRVTSQQFGQHAAERVYDLPEGALMSWAAYREQMRHGFEPGTAYELKLYEPGTAPDRLTPAKVEILERETIDLFGRQVNAIRAKQTLTMKGMLGAGTEMETLTWFNDAGDPVKIKMEMLNVPLEIMACPKTVALSPNDPADLLIDTMIEVRQPVDAKAESITYAIGLKPGKDKGKPLEVIDTGMQHKLPGGRAGKVLLQVNRMPLRSDAGGREKLTDQEKERYLAASAMVNYKDPEVAKLYDKAVGREKDPHKVAEKLVGFVDGYINSKNLGVGFATASEVARTRSGDCSEHGILLAALGRAAGIPTRVVAGVVYADQFAARENIFAGHMWTQFFIDGRWIDLDATRSQSEVDATHIALSVSDAGDSGLADLVTSVWLNLGNLTIEVVK